MAVEVAQHQPVVFDVIDRDTAEAVAVGEQRHQQQPTPAWLQFAPEDDDHQRGTQEEPDRQFEVGVEDRWRDQADESSAERAADREHQIEQRQRDEQRDVEASAVEHPVDRQKGQR